MQQTANPAEPFLSAAGNGLLLIQTPDDGGFSTFRASNGSLAWHFSPAPLQKGSTFTYQQVLVNGAIYFLQDAWPCHSPLATGTCPQEQISLLALSQNDGKTLWQKHLPMPDTSQLSQFKANNSNLWGENDFALAASYLQAFRNSSLAVAGVHLYLNTYGIALAVLNVSNGVQIWQDPDSTFRATAQPTPGNDRCPGTAISSAYNAPLTEVNNRTYVARDGALHALDARTGKVLWTLNASPDGSFTTPIFYRNVLFAGALAIPGARFCPGSGQDAVVAINPSTGSVYWSTTNATSLVGIFPL